MSRLFLCLALLVSLLLAGCEGVVQIQGAVNLPASTTSGTVSIVQVSAVSGGNGTSVQVTVVTLLQPGTAQTTTFCGSQVGQFPMDTFVTATFNQGPTCASLVSVTKS